MAGRPSRAAVRRTYAPNTTTVKHNSTPAMARRRIQRATCMVGMDSLATSADVRQLQQLLQVPEQPVRIPARIVAHHEVAERIDHEQRMLAPRGGKLAQQRRPGGACRVQDLEARLLACEEFAGTAVAAGEEHPLEARHVLVEREARLTHHVKRLAAGAVAGAVADVHQGPLTAKRRPARRRRAAGLWRPGGEDEAPALLTQLA